MTAFASVSRDVTSNALMTDVKTADTTTVATTPITFGNEAVRFQDRGVMLTDTAVQFDFQIYPLETIYGINLREQSRNQAVVFGLIVIGSFLAVGVSFMSFIGAAIVLGVCALLIFSLHLFIPSTHILRFITPEGEKDVLMTRDRKYVQRIFEALNTTLANG